ncbi:hypothetical protein ACFSAU_10965 [Halolamina litorea]|uniref:Uncharacterized protein n=2 Tax=Halolamina litorea TaxID=1515593 RepID=A0ABD6BT80_9EURY
MNTASYERFVDRMDASTTTAPDQPSLSDLRTVVESMPSEEFAEIGQAIREDMDEPLDEELLSSALDELAGAFDDFEDLREMGVPRKGETPYADLTDAAWIIDEHLTETGFYESAEAHMPRFSPEHIADTTRQLLTIDELGDTLGDLGFPEDEQVSLLTNIVSSSNRLSWWGKAEEYPQAEEPSETEEKVVASYVSPLPKRAVAGSLLWIDGLDWRLWQYEYILTEDIIEKGVWDTKSMLAGVYLLGDAARDLAGGSISDEDLATLLIASQAIMFIGQELVADDVARINDEDRKPLNEVDFDNMSFE